jgi:hypothetical protein
MRPGSLIYWRLRRIIAQISNINVTHSSIKRRRQSEPQIGKRKFESYRLFRLREWRINRLGGVKEFVMVPQNTAYSSNVPVVGSTKKP